MKTSGSDTLNEVSAAFKLFFAFGLMILGAAFGYRFAENQRLEPRGESRQLVAGAEASNGPVSDAIRNALGVEDSLARVAALANLLSVTPPSALPQVVNAMEAHFIDLHELENVLFVDWWSSFDPQAAYAWTRGSYKANHPRAMMRAIENWARQDPLEARNTAQGLPNVAQLRESGEMALVAGWDDSGQEGMVEHVMSLPQGVTQQMVMDTLLRRRLLRDGVDSTVAWVDEFPANVPGNFRMHLRRRAAAQLVRFDPEEAMEVVRQWVLADGDATLFRLTVIPFAREDAMGVMSWLQSESELDYALTDNAVKEGYRVWLSNDRPAALAWLSEQPPSRRMDQAFSLRAVSVAKDDLPRAMVLTEKVGDEKARRSAVLKILRFWWITDSETTDAWIAENNIDEEIVARIKRLPPGQEKLREANQEKLREANQEKRQ